MTLYRNSLGSLEPNANISHYGGTYGKSGYLALSTTAINNPHKDMRWDNTPDMPDIIARWAADNGYDIVASRDGNGAYSAALTHRETSIALAAIRADHDRVFAGAVHGYIRLGGIPECGYSHNHATGGREPGVSVFEAEFAASGEYRPILDTNQQLGSYLSLIADGRPVYRVYGERVGYGGDGEPCLRIDRIEEL